MSPKKILLLALWFCCISFVPANPKKVKTLYYYNSTKELSGLKLSHKPGIYTKPFLLKIDGGGKPNFTMELITDNRSVRFTNSIKISSPSVLKISYNDANGVRRNFIGNYIVNVKHDLPIVALVVEPDEFFPPNGIYEGRMEKNPNGGGPRTIGKAWDKKPITGYAQFFFNGELKDELELDIKTYGGMTLGWKEKSLQLSARKKLHGEGKIKVKLFQNLEQREFQHVVLRTSGNDQNKTRVKDMSISQVAEDIGLNTKASRQVVVYINGKYWGIHNLREKVNEDYFTQRYNWKKGSFIEIQGSGDGNPEFQALINYVKTHNGDRDFYQRVSDSIDVENFFNFNIFQTYISNVDYRGNVRFFKQKGGKWRWLVYDTDLACGNDFISRNFIQDRTVPIHEYWYNPEYATSLLSNMLKNKDFKAQFIKQYTYLMATYVNPENFDSKLDANIARIKNELPRHWARRDHLYSETETTFNGHVKSIRTYFQKRPQSAYTHLKEAFNLKDPVPIEVQQNILHFNGITMNGSGVRSKHVKGKFFSEFPIELAAVNTNHLYVFDKWSDGIKNAKRVIKPKSGDFYKAEFKHLAASKVKDRLVIDKYFVDNDWKNPLLFVAITNKTAEDAKLDNFTLYEDMTGSSISLNGKLIKAGSSLVLTNDSVLFRKKVKDKSVAVSNFMVGKTFVDDVKFVLIENNKGWVDSLEVHINDKMLIDHSAYIASKTNSKVKIEHMKMKELSKLKFQPDIQFDSIAGIGFRGILKRIIFPLLGVVVVLLYIYKRRKIKDGLGMFLILISFSFMSNAQGTIDTNMEGKSDRFGLSSIEKKVIDNKGKGDVRFDGTRNFRVVLYDMVYRGGGNNLHLIDTIPKYYLWNPMPLYGLRQLQKVGFDKAYYLYSYNFDYWYPQHRLDSLEKAGFDYVCEPNLNETLLTKYFQDIMSRAKESQPGMIYIHCWNGWHQSGLLSAYTLMQFCDYTNDQALKYWEKCTDGNYKGFSSLKTKIKTYTPMKGYYFTEEQKKRFCPCTKDVAKPDAIQNEDDKINLEENEMMEHAKNEVPKASTKYTYHTIKSGESLRLIAEKYGMGVSELQKLNAISGATIYAGNKLKVIDRKGIGQKSPSSSLSANNTYKVKSGDSLYSIAQKHHTTVDKLKKLNGLKNATIHLGDVLKIPK